MSRTLTLFALALVLLCPTALAERLATSGAFTVDLDNPPPNAVYSASFAGERGNILVNPGFEAGVLAPWTTQAWTISTNGPHSGIYCAYDIGNNWIMQTFAPTPVAQVLAISTWHRQPEIAISAIDLYYGPSDYDEFLVFLASANWEFFDVTSLKRPVGNLEAIRIWGYSGGGALPDETFLDDILVDVEGVTPAATDTWGLIKSLYR